MVPEWLPGTRSVVFTLAVIVAGVEPEAGVTTSQLTPDSVVTVTVKLTGSPVLSIWIVCGSGAGLPSW